MLCHSLYPYWDHHSQVSRHSAASSHSPQHVNPEPIEPLPLDFECGQLDGESQLLPRAPVVRVTDQPVQHSGYESIPCPYGTISRTVVSSCSSTRLVLCVVLCGTWAWTYSTTEIAPPDSSCAGQRERRVSPVDRGSPAAPSSPHVHSASDLCMRRLVSQHEQTQASSSISKQAMYFHDIVVRTPYGALRLSGIVQGCCAHDSVPLLDPLNQDGPISLSPLSPQPNCASRRRRPPLPLTLADLPCRASQLRR